MLKKIILSLLLVSNAQAFEAKYAIAQDNETGAILYSKNADKPMYPASMTKIMTAYILFEELKSGRISLNDEFKVSEKAWKMGGSKMFVELGNKIPIYKLLRGMIVQSGNDACIVLAEGVSGSDLKFIERMNETAKKFGMKHTNFVNIMGWPDTKHITTANDLAILVHRIITDFPEFYEIFSEKSFTYHNIKQNNRNLLLNRDISGLKIDGLKTGHTETSGYGMAISAKSLLNNNRRINVIVNGLSSSKSRSDEAEKIAKYAMDNFYNKQISNNIIAKIPVAFGSDMMIGAILKQKITLPKHNIKDLHFKIIYKSPLIPPIQKNDKIAYLSIELMNGKQIIPLYANKTVGKANIFRRAIYKIF